MISIRNLSHSYNNDMKLAVNNISFDVEKGETFGILYMLFVGYFAGIKRNPTLLRMVKMKLGKNMTDDKAAMIALVFSGLLGVIGVFLLVFGATR